MLRVTLMRLLDVVPLLCFRVGKTLNFRDSLPTLVSSGENICGEFEREILKGNGWNFMIFLALYLGL